LKAKCHLWKDLKLPRLSMSLTRLLGGRRASVGVWIAVMMPGLFMAVAMGVEAGGWAAAQVSVQRTADLAAIAGGIVCSASSDKCTASGTMQTAATFAARMAQLNGGTGVVTGAPAWNPPGQPPNTLTDNMITVSFPGGYPTTALQVTVQKAIPATVSTVFNATASYTVTGSGIARPVTTTTPPAAGSAAAGQPCLLALSSSGTVSGQGSTYWTMPNCTVRSNGTVDVTGGGGPLNTAGIFAAGAVNIGTGITVTGGKYPNSGTIADPYASNTALQTDFTNAAALTGVSNIACGSVGGVLGTAGQYTGNNNCNGTNTLPNGGTCVTANGAVTCTMYPGNYGSWTATSGPNIFNMQPGLYLFKGAISLTNNTTTNGLGGVTIITAGSFTGSNSFNFNVNAPTPTEVTNTGGVAAIALASSSSTTATISGNAAFNVAGVAYFPHAIFDASGSSCNSSTPCFGNNSTACLEIIALSIKTTGNSNFNSNCTSFGAATFTSTAGTTTTAARVVH
jgi:hypothetical protein